METKEQLESLLEKIKVREQKARKRVAIYTLIPVILAIILIVYTGYKVTSAQRELSSIEQELEETQTELEVAERQVDSLNAHFNETISTLSKIVAISNKIEDYIEQKESFLRTLDEAQFLIGIRMLFDDIDSEFAELPKSVSGIPDLERNRTWITIVESSKNLEDLKNNAERWIDLYSNQVSIYKSSNNYFALAIKGDGSFTNAYKLTVELQENGLANDAYFASSKDWGENYLE